MGVEALALVALGFAAWFVSTLGAGGGAILLLPVAAFLYEPRDVPPMLAVASVVGSVQRVWLYRREVVWRVFAANVPGLALGTLAGAWLLRSLDAAWLVLGIGAFLVLYGLSQLRSDLPAVPARRARPRDFALASFATASLSTVVGAAGPMMNPVYLQSGILAQAMIGTKAASTLAMQVAKLGSFASLGVMRAELWMLGLLLGAGALLGNAAGKAALRRISLARFVRIVNAVLVVSGGAMALRGLRELLGRW